MQGQPGEVVRVVLVDDSEILIETMVATLAPHPGVAVVGTALDAAGAIDAVDAHRPDVVLLDLRLGAVWGLDLVPALRAGDHPPTIVVFSAAADDLTRDAVLQAGAQAQVSKGAPISEVVDALCEAAARRRPGADARS
ncbi:MAG: response regulator transcription factor [Acidimicrobiia bacterium]